MILTPEERVALENVAVCLEQPVRKLDRTMQWSHSYRRQLELVAAIVVGCL